jgi:hypothetical protein
MMRRAIARVHERAAARGNARIDDAVADLVQPCMRA